MKGAITSSAALLAAVTISCAGATALRMPASPPSAEQMDELWRDPGPERRDLFYGIGGKRYAPPPDAVYTLIKKDELGFSVSYDVKSPDDTEWSAKTGPEAQTEVVLSRVLWGLGYHQPPVYYLPSWKLAGDDEGRKESEARFRPKLEHLKRKQFWLWQDNPFVGTRPFKGLLVTLLMFNSTDLKNDNNSIYELPEAWDGARRWFVVRDLGASLGDTGKLYPRRNWIEGFENHGFIAGVKDGRVDFHYQGRHQELVRMITPADVRWAAARLQRLTDEQWRDAFRSANYADPIAARYVRKLKEKIAQGLALPSESD